MAIADWIREHNRKNRDKLLQQGYKQGYADALAGKPKRPPGADLSDRPEST